jgi:hypothetical protein
MIPTLSIKALARELLVLLGWITRRSYIEVAGPVSTHIEKH